MDYVPFRFSWDAFRALDDASWQESLTSDHATRNESWIDDTLERLGAFWLVVGGTTGKIYGHGQVDDFPEISKLEQLAESTNEIPFAWSIRYGVEEGGYVVKEAA